jgi:hypothetical protein
MKKLSDLKFHVMSIVAAASTPPITNITQVQNVANKIVSYVGAFFWIAAVASGLYSAFLYMTSQGSPEKLGKAGKSLLYTVVACVVAIMAYGIPALVDSFIKP